MKSKGQIWWEQVYGELLGQYSLNVGLARNDNQVFDVDDCSYSFQQVKEVINLIPKEHFMVYQFVMKLCEIIKNIGVVLVGGSGMSGVIFTLNSGYEDNSHEIIISYVDGVCTINLY